MTPSHSRPAIRVALFTASVLGLGFAAISLFVLPFASQIQLWALGHENLGETAISLPRDTRADMWISCVLRGGLVFAISALGLWMCGGLNPVVRSEPSNAADSR